MNHILKNDRSLSHAKPKNWPVACRFHSRDFFFGKGTASSIVSGHLPLGDLFLPQVFQPFI
jgi:hypothetical protein